MTRGVTRRGVLRAGGVSLLAGLGACSGGDGRAGQSPITAASASGAPTTPTVGGSATTGTAPTPRTPTRPDTPIGARGIPPTGGPFVDVADSGVANDGKGDVTDSFQNALRRAAGGVLHVPAGRYRVRVAGDRGGALRPESGTFIDLDPGAIIEAIPTAVDFGSLWIIDAVSDVTIRGGTMVGDREGHLSDVGEQGHLIAVFASTDIRLENLTVTGAWGDGVIIGYGDGPDTESRRVTVSGLTAIANRRLGLSVIGGHDIEILDSQFVDTNGTNPQAGIDLEPEPGYSVERVTIRNCRASRNVGDGILLGGLPSDGAIGDVTIAECETTDNGIDGLACISAARVTVTGLTTARNAKSGLSLNGIDGASVTGLLATGNGEHGVTADPGVTSLEMTSATIKSNGGNGIVLRADSAGCRVNGGIIADNGETGIDLVAVTSFAADGVTLADNRRREIIAEDCDRVLVHGCSIRARESATEPMVQAISTSEIELIDNHLAGSGNAVISVDGSGDSSVIAGNTVTGATLSAGLTGGARVEGNVVL